MPKHLREALRLAGIPRGQVQIKQRGHLHVTFEGRTITCSCSPKDPHTATMRIARQMKKPNP